MPARILIVDDDDDARESLAEVLRAPDVEVTLAGNGQQALDLIRAGDLPPTLILLDLKMPVMGGVSFLQHRAIDPKIGAVPVVVLSADTSLTDELEGTVLAFLAKPMSLPRLRELIESLHHPDDLPAAGAATRPTRLAAGTRPPPMFRFRR